MDLLETLFKFLNFFCSFFRHEKVTLLSKNLYILIVYSQNVGFGLPSTFDWMEKYVVSGGNPSEIDIFDPFANHLISQKGLLCNWCFLDCNDVGTWIGILWDFVCAYVLKSGQSRCHSRIWEKVTALVWSLVFCNLIKIRQHHLKCILTMNTLYLVARWRNG